MFPRINRAWVILLSTATVIKIFSIFPQAVEKYYSNGLYLFISGLQRFLLGWIPFSIGDILYLIAGFWLCSLCYRLIRKTVRKQINLELVRRYVSKLVFGMLMIYVIFNLAWGLNYNRIPMIERLGLKLEPYSTGNLRELVRLLALRLNSYDSLAVINRPLLKKKRYLFTETAETYRLASREYSFLKIHPLSVKPSIFSYAGNYLGFTGYYNPFSGEAQTNTTVPVFLQPFTTCHEIGHQLGYAKENEANFAGFLSARSSANPNFLYSMYFDLFSYSMRELGRRDSLEARSVKAQLNPQVRSDLKELQAFYLKYENPIEPIIRYAYGNYLRANEQPQGMRSYNEVVAMIVAYYRRYGEL